MAGTPDNNDPFAFGDGTLMQLRDQHWDFDELGTMMVTPPAAKTAEPLETVEVGEETKMLPAFAPPPAIDEAPAAEVAAAPVAEPGDPLARIEQRLEELTRAVLSMQRRLDSIDQAMARFLTR